LGFSRVLGGRCAAAIGVLGAAFAVAAAGPAGAQSGGGAVWVPKPVVKKVSCLRACASRHRAQGGSTLKITGDSLSAATRVIFHGSTGRSDDAESAVRPGSAHRLNAKVPVGAVTGPVSVVTGGGASSRRTRTIAILPAPPPVPNATLTPAPGAPQLETGTSRTQVFIGARQAVSFSYRVSSASSSVGVDLVRASDGAVVKTWPQPATQPGQVQTVVWTGALGRAAAAPGRYSFRLSAQGADGQVARSSQAGNTQRDAFDLYENVFPIRGKHSYGLSAGRFGAGRSGHTHQGQDTFAKCGTRLVAARGGKVKYAGYQSLAGYYLVIDGSVTGLDYVYMHLAEPSPFRTGDRVYTGQRIGSVGDTGDAQGCHLHFELWSAPGWYSGGRPFDPLPSLKAWDGWS
jgi:murein DD-endopeptidase MepM/ murein hydrolase activator NlpD